MRRVPKSVFGVITDPPSVLTRLPCSSTGLLRAYPQYAGRRGLRPRPTSPFTVSFVQCQYERVSRGLAVIAHYTIAKMMPIGRHNKRGQLCGRVSGLQNWKNLRVGTLALRPDIPQRA